jgi:hypothetical protein
LPRLRDGGAASALTPEMSAYLLHGAPSTWDRPLIPGTKISGRWAGLLRSSDGGDARIEAAWRQHRPALLAAWRAAGHRGHPMAWFWYDAPPGQRRPIGWTPADDDDLDADEDEAP